jgi:hypothetical protein
VDLHPDLDRRWARRAERAARRQIRRQRRRGLLRRHPRLLLLTVLVCLLAAGGVFGQQRGWFDSFPVLRDRLNETAGIVRYDPANPFAGTVATGWAAGGAGIVAPPPTPVGPYTADQVGAVTALVRQTVIAARLDRAVIEGHELGPALAHLAPLVRADAEQAPVADRGAYATHIAQGHRLVAEPRVNGTMAVSLDGDQRLVVATDYSVAYAFHTDEPDRVLDPYQTVVVERWKISYTAVHDGPPEQHGLFLGESDGMWYSMDCDLADQGFLAPAGPQPAGGGEYHQSPEEYFDPAKPVSADDSC